MADPKGEFELITLLEGEVAYAVYVRWLPRVGELLKITGDNLKEPRFFEVTHVVHTLGDGRSTPSTQLHVKKSTDHRLTGKKKTPNVR
jgi:hypothetical protein